MERCVALLILAALVSTAGHQQLHNLHMPYEDTQEEKTF